MKEKGRDEKVRKACIIEIISAPGEISEDRSAKLLH
jgi:hypothetical protein